VVDLVSLVVDEVEVDVAADRAGVNHRTIIGLCAYLAPEV
jgi:hypothetical protein